MKLTGELIRTKRIEKGLSQQQLADKLYVTRQAVSNYEREISVPDEDIIKALCLLLDIEYTDDRQIISQILEKSLIRFICCFSVFSVLYYLYNRILLNITLINGVDLIMLSAIKLLAVPLLAVFAGSYAGKAAACVLAGKGRQIRRMDELSRSIRYFVIFIFALCTAVFVMETVNVITSGSFLLTVTRLFIYHLWLPVAVIAFVADFARTLLSSEISGQLNMRS